MGYCKEDKENWPDKFVHCPTCGKPLIRPGDEAELIMSLENRILGSENHADLFTELTEIMTKELSAKIFTLYLYDPISHELVLRAATGIPDEFIGHLSYEIKNQKKIRYYVTSWLFEQGKQFYTDDIKKIKYDSIEQSFILDKANNDKCYSGNYVSEYYSQVPVPYHSIPFVSFMGAGLVRPGTQEKLGVIKAELKVKEGEGESIVFDKFSEREIRIFKSIVPTIALGVYLAQRMEEIKLLRNSFEKAINIIVKVYLETLSIKDSFTYHHSLHTAKYASVLGFEFFTAKTHEMTILMAGALLHDLGKKNIDTKILQKVGRLDENEKKELELHPEKGVSIYYEQFHESLDDLSWLFIPLLHHTSRDANRSYPSCLNTRKDWCHNFVSAFGLDPANDIYNQLERERGNIYKNYNQNVRPVYSYESDLELDHRYNNLKRMIEIVQLADCIDAGTFVRPYNFEPRQMDIVIDEILKGDYGAAVKDALRRRANELKAICQNGDYKLEI